MSANLPPQFFTLSEKSKEAKTAKEKLSFLEEMLAICPKHKGTEKVQKDLKTKIAKLKREAESKKKTKKEQIYTIKREGAGQIVISGPPNPGKTSLINALTQANFKVANYPFATTLPQPAMMPYEDISIQLIDTPPLTKDFSPGWLKNILINSDGILAVFDISKEDFENEIEEFKKILENLGLKNKKILFLCNKIDLINQKPSVQKEKLIFISALKKIGLGDLKRKIFEILEIVRVYSKKPGKEPDLSHPFIFKNDSRLIDLISEIHQDLAQKFKYARLFERNSKTATIIGKDYLLKDGDIVEVHF